MRFVLPALQLTRNAFASSQPTIGRVFSTSRSVLAEKSTVPIALISKIRNLRPGTPMNIARSALLASGNDLDLALKWLVDEAAKSGAVKAEKLSGRLAQEGLVGVILENDGLAGEGFKGVRGAMVEIGCETDFVARTDEFRDLVEGVARSLSFFAESVGEGGKHFRRLNLDTIKDVPMLPPLSTTSSSTYSPTDEHHKISTISAAIAGTVARLGENISLKRAVSISIDDPDSTYLASTYLHGVSKSALATGSPNLFQSGTLAGVLLLKLPGGKIETEGLKMVLRSLARQVVAVPTTSVAGASSEEAKLPVLEGGEVSTALYDQPIMTMASTPAFEFEAGSSVRTVLEKWSASRGIEQGGLQVIEVERWEVGGE